MANKLSAATDINVDEGNIWYFSTNETGTATPNIRYSAGESLNNKMLMSYTSHPLNKSSIDSLFLIKIALF